MASSLLFATDITLEATAPLPRPGKHVWVANFGGTDYAFVNVGTGGVQKIRISDTTVVATFTPSEGWVEDIWLEDSFVFVATWADTFLYILDRNLNIVGKYSHDQWRAEAVTVTHDGYLVFIAVRDVSDPPNKPAYLCAVNADDPSNPKLALGIGASGCCGDRADWEFKDKLKAPKIAGTDTQIVDIAVAGYEPFAVSSGYALSSCHYAGAGCSDQWRYCRDRNQDRWFVAVLSTSPADTSWKLSLRRFEFFHEGNYAKHLRRDGGCPSCSDYTVETCNCDFVLPQGEDDYYVSDGQAYQMWIGGHCGTEYAFVACGSEGLWVFPLDPSGSFDDDIRDPIISSYKASPQDDYRDVHLYGDLVFLANYGDTVGEKLFSVLNASELEDSVLEESAYYEGYFGEGIWGDSLKVYVVGDSL